MDIYEDLQPNHQKVKSESPLPLAVPENTKPESKSHLEAQGVFADGMSDVFLKLLKHNAYKFYKNYNLSELMQKHDDLLYKLSKGYCDLASANLLNYLHAKHPDLYDRYLIIRSNHGPFINESWEAHQVAFVREKGTDRWYAGSPANYNTEKKANFSDVMYAGNLEEIMSQLRRDYQGVWPDIQMISSIVQNEYHDPVQVVEHGSKKIGILTVETKYAPIDKSMRGPNLSLADIPILTRPSIKTFDTFA